MNTAQVDKFSARLAAELAALNWNDRNELLSKIGRMELQMRGNGQERPIWKGPLPEVDLLGTDVVVPTDQGERRGRVICYGVMNMGSEYERSVIVHVPASGTRHEAAGSVVRIASPDDTERMKNEIVMAERLAEAAYAAERGPTRPEQALKLQRKRGMKDPELVKQMMDAADKSKNVKEVVVGSSNWKIVGLDPNKRIYVFKTQLRVDISGFTFDHPGLRKISPEEARDMHLGKVQGQILFEDRKQAFAAFERALEGLK
jgi:hypothetical protein